MKRTYGTDHVNFVEFHGKFAKLEPGECLVYATGDVATSRRYENELRRVADAAYLLAQQGRAQLFQLPTVEAFRNGGGRCFHYVIRKCSRKSAPQQTTSRTNSSLRSWQRAEERELA